MNSNKSCKQIIWQHLVKNSILAAKIAQTYKLEHNVANLIANRITNLDDIEEFINPKLNDYLPNPSELSDVDKASERICEAISRNQKIIIFGDYDVDGATSSALIARFFHQIGYSNFEIYIPDRIKEGYGPNLAAFKKFCAEKTDLIITVDCGTLSFEAINYAAEHQVDVIVLDHHLSDLTLPKAYAIVNPNRLDEKTPYRNLAAVGVCFLTIIAVNRELRKRKFYNGKKEPDLILLTDLVAVGTVCDVMTLTGINRHLVSAGLKILLKRKNLGLAALLDIAGINEAPNVYHLGFVIGPRINAAGRIGDSGLGAKLLTCYDPIEAKEIAEKLNHFNNQRKASESLVLEEAMLQAEQAQNNKMIIVHGDGWHPGVIGIVCSRIKEKFQKPTAVIAFEGNIGKASLRSVNGVDIGALVVNAKNQQILMAGGGHAMAAGFTIERDKLTAIIEFFDQKIERNDEEFTKRFYEMQIPLSYVNHHFHQQLQIAAPFGNGNEEPLVKIEDLKIVKLNSIKNDTIQLILGNYHDFGDKTIKAIIFKAAQNNMNSDLLGQLKGKVTVIGRLNSNNWNDKTYTSLIVEDIICP
jgi:single-stranded-DNA-specific exonuclease